MARPSSSGLVKCGQRPECKVDVLDVTELRELLRARMALLDPLPEHRTGELARDDRGWYVVTYWTAHR
ncbi:hypothetical protein [Candidatus Nephthysia bennettiae]|uniref:Uncharacterized protein n=1 Tax=Candidatus Nephthysia bennettiae TaxID=3127016 RepID=A0A934K2Q2_9BACT|nr:hypothetical protein [Candidatus Dormibacteraeota bacterium]